MTTNQALAVAVIGQLRAAGVKTFCVCPGGRNAPLVEALDGLPDGLVEVLTFFDERSAGFFALGRARRDAAPVAVVTTSGTAAAELLPAMVEAYYSSAPLVAVTADRPRAYRGSGAPQAIEQVRLFGTYATASVDLEQLDDMRAWPAVEGPAHVNVCFPEPLLAGWSAEGVPDPGGASRTAAPTCPHADRSPEVGAFLAGVRSPLVLAGALHEPADRDLAAQFCRELGAPVLAEASSGLRSAPGLRVLCSGDAAAQRGFAHGLFDAVVRIGDVPSFRTWRDLDGALTVPVLCVSRKPWRGLTRGTHVHVPPGAPLPLPLGAAIAMGTPRGVQDLIEWDRQLGASTERLLDTLPESEPSLVRRLSRTIPDGSCVYLGNSLPIREWNQFATRADRGFIIGESRGANGIDGQVATFLGWARHDVENWAILGDLTALYDLSSLWALRHLGGSRLRIVVINNGGGRIFERLFRNERFQNRHSTGFEAWAAMWGAEYHAGFPDGPIGPSAVIELRPGEDETEAFWTRLAGEARA